MDIKTDQITDLLKKQLEKYNNDIDVAEVGEIIEVGDGVSRASGLENVMSSESVIRDADMAEEMTGFTRNQIMTDSATAMLAQANSRAQSVLRLLQ